MRYRLNLDRLAKLLAGSRVSQNHWAIRLGFSRGHWSDIVNGRHLYPSAKTRLRMVEVFGVTDLFAAEATQRDADVDFRIAISGRYELTREIGHGGMGTVHLANDLALGRLVAIKVVSAEAVAGCGADQLLKEIAHVARLQHPNILPLYDAGTGAGSPYYVMPYIRGGSLGARLRDRGRLPLDEVVALTKEIALGLSEAHGHRVLHCDIKPENVLVDGSHPYVMDFGIARKLHTEANEWSGIRRELDFSAGTPAYVSPEQAAGDQLLDERSDVYSLACVVYEMLTGRVAFAGDNTQEIVSLRFREPPPPLQEFAPEVPYTVARAIEHAMALDPDRRPANTMAFADELGVAAQSASSLATTISVASTRVRRWTQLRPARAIRTGGFTRMLDTLKQDVAYGIRQRMRAPALTAIAVCTLAVGIGLATTVFALVDGVLLRPLPFPQQDRLVALDGMDSTGSPIARVSASDWFDWRATTRTLAGTAIYQSNRTSLVANDQAIRTEVATVSPDFFRVIGARFLSGRGFDSSESSRGRGGVVVSEEFWRRTFGAGRDSARTLLLDGYPMPIVGVLARGQAFPADAEVWASYTHRQVGGGARNNINWYAVGRLAPGATIDQSTEELTRIARRVHDADPLGLYGRGVQVLPLREQLASDVTSLLELLGAAVAVVMLIACANLASANLAQGAQRLREMAVRSALGASRYRLVRQVLVENIVLAAVGGMAGIGVAWVLLRTAAVTQGAKLPHITDIGMNPSVLAAAAALALTAGVLTGLLPALQASHAAPNDVLGGSARGTVLGGRNMPGRVLVAAEIAMALVLVTAAGLFVQSFRAVLAQPLGFTTQHVAVAEVALAGPKYRTDSMATRSYWDNLLRSLRTAPGVRAAALANWVPLFFGGTGFVELEGSTVPDPSAGYRVVSDGYFDAIQMKRLAGRDFGDADGAATLRVAIINKSMADKYWPGRSPLGQRVRATSMEPAPAGQQSPWITVIGVVSDVRHFGYETEPMPEMFVYYPQMPAWRLTGMSAVVRGAGADGALLATVRSTVGAQDPTIPIDISLLDDAARRNTASRRFTMSVLSLFGLASLALAGIGVYGVLSFSVAQRTREMAVRSALGADRGSIVRLVLANAGAVVLAGIVLGVAVIYAGGRFVESMLFDVKAGDPIIVAAAALVIFAVGAVAAALPARRATRADPMEALRNDG